MHRVATDLFWNVLATYIALVVLRETSILLAPYAPSVTRALEFGIGTGGRGGGSSA